MLRDKRAYSMTFWAIFIGVILVPIMALGIDVGRYLYARQELGKAADAAAVGAVTEVDMGIFRESGQLVFTSRAYSSAQHYADTNNAYLAALGIHARVTGIRARDDNDTVYVSVSADLSRLFPSIVPAIFVTETGTAQVRAFQR